MASIYQLKSAFQGLLRPVVARLVKLGVTPNQVTLAALALSAGVGGLLYLRPEARSSLLLLPAALFLRMALNAIDGMMAREHSMTTRLGALLNELGDVISDAVLYLPLAAVEGVSVWLMVPIVLLAVIGEMTGVLAQTIGSDRRYDGPMGKSDRAFVFGALGLALGLGAPPGRWIDVVLTAVLLLSVVTIGNRARKALREVSD